MGIEGGLYMLLGFDEALLAGVLASPTISDFWGAFFTVFGGPLAPPVPDGCLFIGGLPPGLLPAMPPDWLSTRLRLGLYIDFWLFTITSFFCYFSYWPDRRRDDVRLLGWLEDLLFAEVLDLFFAGRKFFFGA